MRFDIERYKSDSSYYINMKPENLAFHDALRRRVMTGRDTENGYTHDGITYYKEMLHSRYLSPSVYVDKDGRINVDVGSHYKNDKAMIMVSDVQECMEAVLEFMTAAFEHGFLLKEDES